MSESRNIITGVALTCVQGVIAKSATAPPSPVLSELGGNVDKLAVARSLTLKGILLLEYDVDM